MTKLRTSGQFPFAPTRGRNAGSVRKLSLLKMAGAVFVFRAATAIASPAQTLTTLHSFDETDGTNPYYAVPVQATDGNLYGTTADGGANGDGTVYEITAGGTLTTLHSFDGTDGAFVTGGLIQASSGNFYGTTYNGGAYGYGTVFQITPGGALTTLHSFDHTDGAHPSAALVQATNGNFYGTTSFGANLSGNCGDGCGTVFEITPSGKLTTLHSFDETDGANPIAALVQATNGNFYGTTSFGGADLGGNCPVEGCGTVFEITPSGKLTTLHSFDETDGAIPYAGLMQATNGDLYGTTYNGGAYNSFPCESYTHGCGTIFEITPGGKLTTLHSFDVIDGDNPFAGLVQGSDGNFYGTTALGEEGGTIFEITPGGTLTTLYSFAGYPIEGSRPLAALVQATNGNFYGTTYVGGASDGDGACPGGCGTVFSLSVGLGPFVEPEPSFGKVGAPVIILGDKLTSVSGIQFNGTVAKFTVVSSSEIETTVPAGATTGYMVASFAPPGRLFSNKIFRVIPQVTSFGPTSGPADTVVTITGVSLTQTTTVTFGGVKATAFTVDSDTQVTATVPVGAQTGDIAVTTLGGTATSATSFTVTE